MYQRFVCMEYVHWFIADEHAKFEIITCSCRTISIQFIMQGYVRLMENLISVKSVYKSRCLSLLPNNSTRSQPSLTLDNPVFIQKYHF